MVTKTTFVTGLWTPDLPYVEGSEEGLRTCEATTGIFGHVIHIFLRKGGSGHGCNEVETNS